MDSICTSDLMYNKISLELLKLIYIYKMSGTDYRITNIFGNNNNVYIGQTISIATENIKIIIIKITFLKTIKISRRWSVFKHKCFFPCSECGKINTQHKYKCCSNYVCVQCAFNNYCKNNKCNQCGNQIVKKKVKMCRTFKKNTCSICLEECNTKIKKCGHYFHKKCIKEYLNLKNSCPMCRTDLLDKKTKIKKFINTPFELDMIKTGFTDIIIKTI